MKSLGGKKSLWLCFGGWGGVESEWLFCLTLIRWPSYRCFGKQSQDEISTSSHFQILKSQPLFEILTHDGHILIKVQALIATCRLKQLKVMRERSSITWARLWAGGGSEPKCWCCWWVWWGWGSRPIDDKLTLWREWVGELKHRASIAVKYFKLSIN